MAEEKLPAELTARQKLLATLGEQRENFERVKKAAAAIRETGEDTTELDGMIKVLDGVFKALK